MSSPCLHGVHQRLEPFQQHGSGVDLAVAQMANAARMERNGWEYLQEYRVFPLLHPFLDQIQGLFQVLAVNGILDLLVPPLEHGVVGSHGERDIDRV